MNTFEAIRTKRAVRQFKDQMLPDEAIRTILNAGRRAQSAKNSQPWHFIAIQDRSTLKAFSELGPWAGHLSGAALGVAIVSPPFEQKFSIAFDLGQAASYMQLAAWELGIGSCLATIYDPEQARQLLGFPTDLDCRVAISFGYPLDDADLHRPPQRGNRRPLDESVHWEKW